MCRVLEMSESSYYRWLKNRSKPTKQQLLLVEINGILAEHEDNDNYGVRRMHTVLWQRGVQVSIRTVYRVMKMAGLLHKKRMPHSIRKADTETQERDNLIKQVFHVDEPLKKLLTDITEMPLYGRKPIEFLSDLTAHLLTIPNHQSSMQPSSKETNPCKVVALYQRLSLLP